MSATDWLDRGKGTSQSTKPQRCPACKQLLDGLGNTTQGDDRPAVPEPGSVSICLVCTSILQFDAKLRIELMPRARWVDEFQDEDRQHLESMSVLCARTATLPSPTTWLAWHGDAWYALSLWPNRLDPSGNLIVRSRPYDTRAPLDELRKKGTPQTLVIGQAGLDPTVMRWRYMVHMESVSFGWRHTLEVSEPIYPAKLQAQEASVAAIERLKEQYGITMSQVLHHYAQPEPKGPLS